MQTLLGNLSKFIPVFVFSYYLLDSIHCSLDIEQSERKKCFSVNIWLKDVEGFPYCKRNKGYENILKNIKDLTFDSRSVVTR